MNIVGVIQARMSSSRFPGKMLAPLDGLPLIVAVCTRAKACAELDDLVVATSDQPDDLPLAAAVEGAGFAVCSSYTAGLPITKGPWGKPNLNTLRLSSEFSDILGGEAAKQDFREDWSMAKWLHIRRVS